MKKTLKEEAGEMIVSTPGRICLFGEHQDYLGLPVIASAISLRIYITGKHRDDNLINIELPDIGTTETFSLPGIYRYDKEKDYFKSSFNVLIKNGFTFTRGIDCRVSGQIPINAGTSSSSALIVAWINLLSRMSDNHVSLNPEQIAEFAFRAEVEEFNEPGGRMDHYTTSLGNTVELNFYPSLRIRNLKVDLGAFVLGNSGEPKDTTYILSRVKNQIVRITQNLKQQYKEFSLYETQLDQLEKYTKNLSPQESELLRGTIMNRDITKAAVKLMDNPLFKPEVFGDLIYRHHTILRDVLKISTRKIDTMIDAAMNAGAYGAKINGSGGGGCMFAYAPENTQTIFDSINKISGEAYIIYSCEGSRQE